MRAEGASVKGIAKRLGVAQSSVSVWVRDVLTPPKESPPISGIDDLSAPRRRCPRCVRDLPETRFNRNGAGRQHWCRDCFREYFRVRGDRHREQSGAAHARRKALAREFVETHLRSHPCVECGEEELTVLEFDHHTGGKTANVARLLGGARLGRIREEIARCEVVCVNCHRRRTAQRAGAYRLTGKPRASWTPPQRRNQEWLLEVLRRTPCIDCGERDPVVLDFDHVGVKRANISRLAFVCSLRVLEAEIAQCVVRCANCHRIRTLGTNPSWRSEDGWAAGLHE